MKKTKQKTNENNKMEYRKNAFLLCIGMTGVVETHILSTEMVIFVLILICMIYFIVPFLDYYCNECVNITVSTVQGGSEYSKWEHIRFNISVFFRLYSVSAASEFMRECSFLPARC